MADKTTNGGTPKAINRATMVLVGIVILLVIFAAFIITSFYKSPTGETTPNSTNSQSR
jgi:preprotein translocase subunit SecG